ncbi:MAG: hypothetical protein GXO15_00865 [Crenarchaeota archaeon]|nr:hypothetical protein [Thermoproteota archaeon]
MARLCLAYAASPIHSRGFLERLRSSVRGLLEAAGLLGLVEERGVATEPRGLAAMLSGCPAAVVVVATGGTEHIVLGGLAGFEGPVLLVAHPYANSLPALLELYPLASRLSASAVALPALEGGEAVSRLASAVRGLLAASRLRGSRLGLVGRPSPWLVYSRVEPQVLRERLGVELVEVPLGELEEEYRRVEPPAGLLEELVSKAEAVERPRGELVKALRLYEALRRIVERHRLDAFTIECFEVIPRLDTTACLALSLFNSSGLVAGCEGDVPATVSMMLLSYASQRPAFMANPASFGERRLLLAHCTAPIAAGASYRLLSHFETGRGVGVSVAYREGETVTLARLDPGLRRLRVARGVVERSGLLSSLHCRTQVWLRVDWDPELLLEDSLGNHYVMTVGDHVEPLRHAARMLGLRAEVLG